MGEYTKTDKEQVLAKYRRFLSKHPKGKISRKSFQSMLSDCLPGLRSDRLAQLSSHIWRVYDINRDGSISKDELERIVKDFEIATTEDGGLVNSVFNEMDENKDGLISQEEFVDANLAQKKCSTRLTLKVIEIFLTG